jgi:hypothetical protein
MTRRRHVSCSRGFPLSYLAIAICASMTISACATGSDTIGIQIAKRTVFDVNWERYQRLPDSKAFALAGDPRGRNVIGLVYKMASENEARSTALDYCEEARVARAIDAPCTILAVNDVILSEAFGPVAQHSEAKRSES